MPQHITFTSDTLPSSTVDTIVIGGGAAGLNGALMLARSRRSVVVIDDGTPRNLPADGVHGLLALEGTPPTEILARGRAEVRSYGGLVVAGVVATAVATEPPAPGDLGFTITLTDGRRISGRRLLVATGVRDELPDVAGLDRHWGRGVVHCPYCHGWEVRDEPIGVLAAGPVSLHLALLFRQLSDDIVFFAQHTDVDEQSRARFAALDIRVVETPVSEVVDAEDGGVAGLRLSDGQVIPRRIVAVATTMSPRTEGLEGLGLPTEDLPNGMGRHFVSGMAGLTDVPGVWVAGNAAEPSAQVGASAAAGALAGAHINALLAATDADLAVAAQAGAIS